MNFFFGIKTEKICSNLTIARFKNDGKNSKNHLLCKVVIKDSKWNLEILNDNAINEEFYSVNEVLSDNENIFFLAREDEIQKFDKYKLKKLNTFTDTFPAYRSNLKINIRDGGFSSFQSEYPFDMVLKRGSILSPISVLLNKNANENINFIKNIYEEPVQKKFNLFFVNIETKKVVEKFELRTNYTNSINVENELIKPEIYLITDKYLGAPLFVSIDNTHMSFEHTHPPHEYIMSKDKFKIISKLKRDISEIIS